MSILEHNHIVLIRPKASGCLMPMVAVFEGQQNDHVVTVEVETFEMAMRQFKLTVQVDTSVAKQVYPYNNAISLIWEHGEGSLVDQVDSFDFMYEKGGWEGPRKQNVRIYSIDDTVEVRSVRRAKFIEWADVAALDRINSVTHRRLEKEILQRAFAILPRIQFEA